MTTPVTPPVIPPAPDAPVTPPVTPPVATPPVVTPADELAVWKAESRKHEARAKENKAAADELATLKAAQLTDAEKATAALATAEKRTADLTNRTVRAEIRALAAESFQDPSDAHLYLDLSKYVDDGGEIDAAAITADLAAVLTSKAHLAKATGAPRLKPNPAQGAVPDGTPAFDQRIAEAQKARDTGLSIALKLAKQEAATTQ
jgi:hypothetical protein